MKDLVTKFIVEMIFLVPLAVITWKLAERHTVHVIMKYMDEHNYPKV